MFLLQFLITAMVFSSSAEQTPCHSLDFDSYFVAQNAKAHLLKTNSVIKANFDHHYLLLRDEMMMEQLYLIADCETGKFFHEKLNGKAEFSLDRPQLKLTQNKSSEIENLFWNGEHFIKVEEKVSLKPGQVQASSATSLPSTYDALFAQYPTPVAPGLCHPLDFDSQFQAQKAKTSILKSKPNYTRPNFGGHQLLVKAESMFDMIYLLANCENGKFTHAVLKGSAVFTPASGLVRVDRSQSFPEFYLFDGEEWMQIPDPVQNRNQKINNTLSRVSSKILWDHLPNPQHLTTLRFEDLKEDPEMKGIFASLGVKLIHAGKCTNEKGRPQCEVETQ